MQFKNKVVVITGGAHGIGKTTKEAFEAEGALVEVIDIAEGTHFVGDISKKEVLEEFASYVLERHGHVDYLINNCISSSVFPKNRKEKFPILGMGYSHISAGNIFI